MIDRNKLRSLIREDNPWGKIIPPAGFTVNYERPRATGNRPLLRTFFSNRAFRLAASALVLLVIGIPAYILYPRGQKTVFTYPYNGEKTVELIGSMNDWNKSVKMRLDPVKKEWIAEIRIKEKGIYEYQFIIDRLFISAGESVYKVRDNIGNEKAVLILTRVQTGQSDGLHSPHNPVTGA